MNTSRITRMLSPYSGCTLNCWQSCRGGYLSLTTFHENALHIEHYLLCFLSICTDPKEASVTSNISEISSISSTSSSPPGALLWVTVWHFYFFFWVSHGTYARHGVKEMGVCHCRRIHIPSVLLTLL